MLSNIIFQIEKLNKIKSKRRVKNINKINIIFYMKEY